MGEDVFEGALKGATVRKDAPFTIDELRRRKGHAPDFLDADVALPLPEAGAGEVWLNYTHFSILMDPARRQPRLTIVDIDGARWVHVKRRRPDVWSRDPRLAPEQQPERRFFDKPDPQFDPRKNHFAFGHMVRRQDPNWHDDDDPGAAERSELETFFITNASPQAETLNTGPWNVLEDIVLDDLKTTLKIRAVVLTGPVFREDDPLLHGVFPIPAEYWKLVAWKGPGGRLSTVAWRQTQPAGVMPADLESAQVPFDGKAGTAWLVPVDEIAELSGLDLGVYAAADTYRQRRGMQESMDGVVPALMLPTRASDLLLIGAAEPAAAVEETVEVAREDEPASDDDGGLAAALADREAEESLADDPEVAAFLESLGSGAADHVSQPAYDLIVQHETGGRAYYEKKYKSRPVWPKGQSGITIGFGYDLGYVGKAEFDRDWAALPAADRAALAATIGRHGGNASPAAMQALLAGVQHVVVGWAVSEAVFRAATLPKFAGLTDRRLDNCDLLSGDSFGALVSLTFNRGASYAKAGDRYTEMNRIREAMTARRFERIPGLILAMRRIWKGTAIQAEMDRRRANEAALFKAGLPQGGVEGLVSPLVAGMAPGFEDMGREPGGTAAPAVRRAVPAGAETWEGAGDEDVFVDVTEDDAADDAASTEASLERAVAEDRPRWAPDALSPDYAHLDERAEGATFTLEAADLELLAELNAFPLDPAKARPVLFGLRGCGLVKDHAAAGGRPVLRDQRPDHHTPRCVLGAWDRAAGTVAVFPGSTVPDRRAVRLWKTSRKAGNLLATGLYGYVVGAHATLRRDGTLNARPGCFLLRETASRKRVVVVRRSSDDLQYQLTDMVDRTAPGDNIHPTFFTTQTDFSSLGCQVVVGSTDSGGNHKGPWAAFRTAAGQSGAGGTPGQRFQYMLLTGAEAAIASELRRTGRLAEPAARDKLRRLRFGSSGEAVRRLQARLGLPSPDGTLGAMTAEALHGFQRTLPPKRRSDGIWSPALDAVLGWDVF
ncbi:DNA/RNA non-specific endonuclease [Methylobacterium aquaticum]|uniref:DNA/RNA non-specific endonuclease n=1 Tax=Methylobacterium aquaticum TaxID=270351 RepID=UPI003D16F83C